MTKRKLTPEELKFCNKSLLNMEQEKDWNKYQIEYHNLMLNTGLDMNHKKNIRDFKAKKREFTSELEIIKSSMRILKDQIRNGVEIKDETVEKEEEE